MTAFPRLVAVDGHATEAPEPVIAAPAGERCPHTEDLARLARQVEQLALLLAHLTGAAEEPAPVSGRPVLRVLQGGGAS